MSSIDIRAEEGVLATLFNDPESLPDVLELINDSDFSEPRYAQIFKAMMELDKDGQQLLAPNVASVLRSKNILPEIGGMEVILDLNDPTSNLVMNGAPIAYATIVQEESLRRKLTDAAMTLSALAKVNSGVTVDGALATAQKALTDISESTTASLDKGASLALIADEMYDKIIERGNNETGIQGIPTGFVKLDKAISGMGGGQMIVIAARPAVGKSTIAVDIARNVAFNAGLTPIIFSLEMSRTEITERVLSAQSDIPLSQIRSGIVDAEEKRILREHLEEFKNVNFIIEDSPNIKMEMIRAKTLQQMRTPEGCDLVIIDFLQLLTPSQRLDSRQQEVAEISRSLKLLAKEINRPILALSQLNRGPEQRADKRPTTADLRESGAIEQDADIVMLLHPTVDEVSGDNVMLLLLAKNRQGPTDDIRLNAILECSKFANEEGQYPTADQNIYDEEGYAEALLRRVDEEANNFPPDPEETTIMSDGMRVNPASGEIIETPSNPQEQTEIDMSTEPMFPTRVDPTDRGEEPLGSAW